MPESMSDDCLDTSTPHQQWATLTAFESNLLYTIACLQDTDPVTSGLTIKAELEQLYQTPINHGRLYPALDTIVEAGLITKRPVDGRTNRYRLTTDGHACLETRASHLSAGATEVQPDA